MQRRSSRGNPNHYPAGSPKGGQFAPKGVGVTISHGEKYYNAKTALRNGELTEAEFENITKNEQELPFAPRETTYVPAKTKKEAEEYAKSLGVKPFYKGLDLDTCNACNQVLHETLNDYPEVRNQVKVIGSGQEINKELKARLKPIVAEEFQARYANSFPQSAIDRGVKKQLNQYGRRMSGYAYFSSKQPKYVSDEKIEIAQEYSGIYINTAKMKDAHQVSVRYEKDVASGFHPMGTDGAEERKATGNPQQAVKSIIDHEMGHALDYAYGISGKVLKETTWGDRNDIANGLSRYALENEKEYVAEAWCEYRNSPAPRKIAMEVGGIIEGCKS